MLSLRYARLLILLVLFGLCAPEVQAQDHFTDCLSSPDNASIVIPDSVSAVLGGGKTLEPGDEIAVFTQAGECAGISSWDGSTITIAAVAEDAVIETTDTFEGFAKDEVLEFRVWDASAGVEYTTGQDGVIFESCSTGYPCEDSNSFLSGAIFTMKEIDASEALPVELSAIDARADGNQATLEWTTVSETNNAGFEVQYQRAEATSWTTLDFVEGHGTTSKPQTYRYTTEDLSVGTHQFRLKQVDFDGAFEYSPTVEVAITLTERFKLSSAYPNPFQHQTNVSLTVAKEQDVEIAVYNTLGQQVAVLHHGPLAPNQAHEFSVEGRRMPSGLYFVRARGESFATTRRITHVK